MLFAIVCALPMLLAAVVRAGAGRVPGLRRRAGAGREPAAALANWRPVAVYGLLLFFYGAVLPGIAIALIALVAPASLAPWGSR